MESKTVSGQVSFGESAAFSTVEERVRWLDWTLKGIDGGYSPRPRVRIFVMGGGDPRIGRKGRLAPVRPFEGTCQCPT